MQSSKETFSIKYIIHINTPISTAMGLQVVNKRGMVS